MRDPFVDDPRVKRLEQDKRRAAAANWKDDRRNYGKPDLENPGICPECGADTIAPDGGFSWCCAECGAVRFETRYA